jgi:hypothetical protein
MMPMDENDMGGSCGIASYVLYKVLAQQGIDSELVYGECYRDNHFWLVCREKIVDITHTQFKKAPKVLVVSLSSPHFIALSRNSKEAVRILKTWQSYQTSKKDLDKIYRKIVKDLKGGKWKKQKL